MTQTEEEYLARHEAEIAAAQQSGYTGLPYSSAMTPNQYKSNLIEWELDFSEELGKIEILLKSAVLIKDKEGNETWVENPNPDRRLLNEVGVQDMLRFIFTLVNKNKVLSNYNVNEIQQRVCMIKHELRMQIYNNYEFYGIDNEYKENNYPMIVHIIGSLIEDAYRRALNGETHRGLNEARTVMQTEPILPQNINVYPGMAQQKKGIFSKMMPWNWGKR